jgi:hypothetical protein
MSNSPVLTDSVHPTVTDLAGLYIHVEEPEQVMNPVGCEIPPSGAVAPIDQSEQPSAEMLAGILYIFDENQANQVSQQKPVEPILTSGNSARVSDELSGAYIEIEAEETH